MDRKSELLSIVDALDIVSEKLEAAGASQYAARVDEIANSIRIHAKSDSADALSELIFSSVKHTLVSQMKNPLITRDILATAMKNAEDKIFNEIVKNPPVKGE